MKDGKLEPGDRVMADGEERIVVTVWSGKDLIAPSLDWTLDATNERSALFAYAPPRPRQK